MECVVLAIQAPEAGKVMQGMKGLLNPTQCVALYQAMIDDALEFTQEIGVKRVIACTPGTAHPYFQEMAKRMYIEMADHKGTTQGQRIKNGLQVGITKGASEVILWDGETPGLGSKFFKEGFSRLAKADLLLGPAMDYGIYMVGVKKTVPDIFEQVKWESPSEFTDAFKAAQAAKIAVHAHNIVPRLHKPTDIPYFLMHLQQQLEVNPRLARNTLKFLTSLNLR